MSIHDRVPPFDLEAEKLVLGSLISSEDTAVEFIDTIKPGYFYQSSHEKIFKAVFSLYSKGSKIDILLISDYLKQRRELEECGGTPYLAELSQCCVFSDISHHIEVLKRKYINRNLINGCNKILSLAYEDESTSENAIHTAESVLMSIGEECVVSDLKSARELLPECFEQIQNYCKKTLCGLNTGFVDLDNILSFFEAGDLIVLAGRASMGKTSFALALALNATRKGYNVAFFSLEMSEQQLIQRALCYEAKINIHSLRSGTLPKRDFPKLSVVAGPLSEAGLFIDDTPSVTPTEIKSKSIRLKKRFGLDAIIIDYIQLMESGKRSDNRQHDVSQITRMLKLIAKELKVPVIGLSQLSRAVEQRQDKRPMLSDLRESGAIEQDADIVMFTYRDEYYYPNKEESKGIAEIIVGKQRNGPVGSAKVAFIKEYAGFENLSKDHVEENDSPW